MKDTLNQQMQSLLQPVQQMVGIQTKMLEALAAEQMACTQKCVEATMQQAKALSQCESPEEVLQLQQEFNKAMESTLTQAGGRNLAIFEETRQALLKLAEQGLNK
ncbi:phasin family protein [Balneatrix alpica]|uniref:Phasin family protein n=1 Tax=Balneatrix alpica TaxID=75684 RepID=A0ABV5ZDV7_9GAMM|nr:phasin family protein [Balneatrix alpica]